MRRAGVAARLGHPPRLRAVPALIGFCNVIGSYAAGWLGTVPLTNGIVAQVFSVRYFAMLGGFVFFSHQIGSFLGAWLGGYLDDSTGSYQIVWLISIALGVAAGLANLPIDERPLVRAPRPAST